MEWRDVSGKGFYKVFLWIGISFLAAAAIFVAIRAVSTNTAAYVLLILSIDFGSIGLIFTIIGGCFMASARREAAKADRLKSAGRRYDCEIVRMYINPHIRVNRVSPIIAECCYTDEYGKRHLVKSKNIFRNVIHSQKDAAACVWVNPNDAKDYYVDILFEPKSSEYDFDDR